MGFNPVTYGASSSKVNALASGLVNVKPSADKTKADYEYADGTIIEGVPLIPESTAEQIGAVVDTKIDSIKSEFVRKEYLKENAFMKNENVDIDWFDVGKTEPIANLMTVTNNLDRNNVTISKIDDITVNKQGTISSNSFLQVASIDTSLLTLGDVYTLNFEGDVAIKLFGSNDNVWYSGTYKTVDGSELPYTFTITQDMLNKRYLGLGALITTSNTKNEKYKVALVAGNEFPNWSDFYERKKIYPHNITDCLTKESLSIKADSSLRFAVATDIHWNHDGSAETGLNGYQKTQILVDAVNAEHHKKPLDFLMITGDVNESGGTATLQEFKDKFMWQFEMPVVLFSGNHDVQNAETWQNIVGIPQQCSLETDDFYFIFVDCFNDNADKTWLSHWSAHYSSADEKHYTVCSKNDVGALLVGTDISLADAKADGMYGWSDLFNTLKNGDYVKLTKVSDGDMYHAPSLEYVKSEVAKANGKNIVLISHQIMQTEDGDTENIKGYLESLDNFKFYLEGHSHIYTSNKNANGVWTLNSGHFHVPTNGWARVASDNYRGFNVLEVNDKTMEVYKVQPTQNVGTQYEHSYDVVGKKTLFSVEKARRADVDLRKLSKDIEFSNKLADLEKRISALE